MKLHLPKTLRSAVMVVAVLVATSTSASAEITTQTTVNADDGMTFSGTIWDLVIDSTATTDKTYELYDNAAAKSAQFKTYTNENGVMTLGEAQHTFGGQNDNKTWNGTTQTGYKPTFPATPPHVFHN